MSDYMKKFEVVTKVGQDKMLSKKPRNIGNFIGSYFKGHSQQAYSVHTIQLVLPVSIVGLTKVFSQQQIIKGQRTSYSYRSKPTLERGCYYYGIIGHLKTECPFSLVNTQAQQQTQAIVSMGRGGGGNGRDHQQDGQEIRQVVGIVEKIIAQGEKHS